MIASLYDKLLIGYYKINANVNRTFHNPPIYDNTADIF